MSTGDPARVISVGNAEPLFEDTGPFADNAAARRVTRRIAVRCHSFIDRVIEGFVVPLRGPRTRGRSIWTSWCRMQVGGLLNA